VYNFYKFQLSYNNSLINDQMSVKSANQVRAQQNMCVNHSIIMIVDICINAGPKWQTGTVFVMPRSEDSIFLNISCKITILKCALGRTSDKIE